MGGRVETETAWQELDEKLQENVVQKNHLLQVLNKAPETLPRRVGLRSHTCS